MSSTAGETLLEEGIVLSVDRSGPHRPGQARIHLVAGDHCDGCPAGALCKPDEGGRRILDVRDSLGVEPGDRVRVMVPGQAVLKASFLVYGLPLLLLLIGVWLGTVIWPETQIHRDLYGFLLGAALAGAAVPIAARWARSGSADGGSILEPRIAEKILD